MVQFVAMTTSMSLHSLIITNFQLYLIQQQFFQIFVFGDVVYAQTWEVMTLQKHYRAILIWQWFNSSTIQALPTEIWGTWKVQRALKWSRKTIPHLLRLHIRAAQIRRFQREFVTLSVVQFVLEKEKKTCRVNKWRGEGRFHISSFFLPCVLIASVTLTQLVNLVNLACYY